VLGLSPEAADSRGGALAQRNDAMNGAIWSIRLAGCAVLLAGCISPQNTRVPTLGYNPDARAERQSYTYLNPLPERETGPAIERPRFYEFSRAEPKRSQDRSAITDEILNNGGANVGSSPSASRYPQSVTP
jgi:hypothetical protein